MITEGTPAEQPATQTGDAASAPTQPKKGLKMSYDEYKQMANLIVLYMRRQEEEMQGMYPCTAVLGRRSVLNNFTWKANMKVFSADDLWKLRADKRLGRPKCNVSVT